MNITLTDAAELLRQRDGYLLITHMRPDGDTLGSAAALCHALRRLGKRACLYPNPETTPLYGSFTDAYLPPAGYAAETLVSVDVADRRVFPKGFDDKVFLALDHHPDGGQFADHTLTRPEKAACGEVVLELIRLLCGDLHPEEASLLYIAVSTDTGCFRYANTTADTFRAAAELVDCGARLQPLNARLFRTKTRSRITLEGLITSNLRSFHNDAINIGVVTLEMIRRTGATEDDCEDLAGLPGVVVGNRASALIRELREGHCKVSVRTDGSVNATAVCQRFGGGGHRMASGCELDMGPEEAVEAIHQAIEAEWP